MAAGVESIKAQGQATVAAPGRGLGGVLLCPPAAQIRQSSCNALRRSDGNASNTMTGPDIAISGGVFPISRYRQERFHLLRYDADELGHDLDSGAPGAVLINVLADVYDVVPCRHRSSDHPIKGATIQDLAGALGKIAGCNRNLRSVEAAYAHPVQKVVEVSDAHGHLDEVQQPTLRSPYALARVL